MTHKTLFLTGTTDCSSNDSAEHIEDIAPGLSRCDKQFLVFYNKTLSLTA